ELLGAEAARASGNPDALDFILRGRAVWSAGPPTPERHAAAISFYERALALEPQSGEAAAWLAYGLIARGLDGMSSSRDHDLQRVEALITLTSAAAPRNPLVHYLKGQVLRAQARHLLSASTRQSLFARAIPEYELALAVNPNDVRSLSHLGWC